METDQCAVVTAAAAVNQLNCEAFPADAPLTVYFDGACPLCRAEIKHYQSQAGADRISFQDLTTIDVAAQPAPGLTTAQAMARFHIRRASGELVSGAAAFVAIWQQLPRWRWAARIASFPGVTPILEVGYRLFLPLRPALSWAFGTVQNWRTRP